MSTIDEVFMRNFEKAIDDHMNRYTYKYDPASDPECDEESVYAFDVYNKRCPNNWHTFKGCHCPNFGIDYDLRSEYAFDTTANGETESVYAFDCEDDGLDKDEPMETSKKYVSLAQKIALFDQAKEERENREFQGALKFVAFLATGCVAFILAFVLPLPFGLMSFLVSSAVFVRAFVQAEQEESCIRQDYEKTVQRIKSLTVLHAKVDDSEANESEDNNDSDAQSDGDTDEIVSVYAFDARDDDGIHEADEAVYPESEDDIDSVDSDNDSDAQSTDSDDDTDEVVSVYAFVPLDNVIHEADEAVVPESDPTEAIPTKSTSSFGIRVPNLGEGLEYCYHADSEDGYFEFSDSVTFFKTNTDKHIFLIFEGQDLKAVINKENVYTSFGQMPLEVADIFVIAQVGIDHLQW